MFPFDDVITVCVWYEMDISRDQGPLLVTWVNVNPSMDK